MCGSTDGRGKGEAERKAQYSRLILRSQSHDGLLTISHERGIAPFLFKKPGAEIVTGTKDAGVSERWGRGWATDEEEGD